MGRVRLFEFGDQAWLPERLRTFQMDFLEYAGNLKPEAYEPFAARFASAMDAMCERRILDLCSGSGGPATSLLELLAAPEGEDPVTICLTDLRPNLESFRDLQRRAGGRVEFSEESVDARTVPRSLEGFRLICNGFHHFDDSEARRIIDDAVAAGRGIAVLELCDRSPLALTTTLLCPLSILATTPFIRPFRWSRIAFTYLLPILPLISVWDGIVSCLRAHSLGDLRRMTEAHTGYHWQVGRVPTPGLPGRVTYLIGHPTT